MPIAGHCSKGVAPDETPRASLLVRHPLAGKVKVHLLLAAVQRTEVLHTRQTIGSPQGFDREWGSKARMWKPRRHGLRKKWGGEEKGKDYPWPPGRRAHGLRMVVGVVLLVLLLPTPPAAS